MKMNAYAEQKHMVYECIMGLVRDGYVQGTGGNVSMLVPGTNLVAVTPSQVEYSAMSKDDICVVDFDLKPAEDTSFKPSMETPMHIAIYKNRPDVSAVVHTHQTYASVFSLIDTPIPALFDEAANAIGTLVEVVPYGLSGSAQLLQNVESKLGNRANCYILKNHGALALASTLAKARRNAELLEKSAKVYYFALSTGKPVSVLPDEVQDLLNQIMHATQDAEIAKKNTQ
ncbi:MAG: class II aldolase/adducin family protein [Spirochaetes bacterium]|nr:MAG: class II aldolase/adducin family protein [Spirochaetota bacterium]